MLFKDWKPIFLNLIQNRIFDGVVILRNERPHLEIYQKSVIEFNKFVLMKVPVKIVYYEILQYFIQKKKMKIFKH